MKKKKEQLHHPHLRSALPLQGLLSWPLVPTRWLRHPLRIPAMWTVAERGVTQMHDIIELECGGGGRGVNNHRDRGPHAETGYSPQRFAPPKIKIMSYNVWSHGDVEVGERMDAIGQLIGEHEPDIIFFQEVTRKTYKLFEGSNWWRAYQCCLDDASEKATGRPDFCMLLSRLPVKFLCEPHENSNMGKGLCVAEIEVDTIDNLVVATSHLKRPYPPEMNSRERVDQATEALRRLNSEPNVIFGGDMNWDDRSDGPFPLLAGWRDAWSVLRPGEIGHTYDTKSNMMLKGYRPLQKRLDRFVCKLQDFRMETVDMLGMDAIPGIAYYNNGKILPVLPSDHYGLLLTIRPV